MKNPNYQRSCPECGIPLFYSGDNKVAYRRWYQANKLNSKCYKCSKTGRLLSQKTKEKMSQKQTIRYSNPEEHKKTSDSVKTVFQDSYKRKNRQIIQLKRYSNPRERKKTGEAVKLAMHRPDVRKRHIAALAETKWLGKAVDRGQIELLNKWNQLGFKFEPNYQLHTDTDLFYVDGYDKKHNVVLEYDSKYHLRPSQQKKDFIRQQKIIDVLKPKKFWRYDAVTKQCKNILEKSI